jgi:hypothetical protein
MLIAAYNRVRAEALLLEWTPQRLLELADSGALEQALGAALATELEHLARSWVQRALGPMPLRDALLVDEQHAGRAWDLVCATVTVELRSPPEPLALAMGAPLEIGMLPTNTTWADPLRRAAATGMALAALPNQELRGFPPPPSLELLLPPPPSAIPPPIPTFEQPTGMRRAVATMLAVLGASFIITPLVLRQPPSNPAGIPLALITLALMLGIRASPVGYLGALCIWLVANLPGFHYGQLLQLGASLPLLAIGVALLSLDRRVRAMWRWLHYRLWRR